MSQESAPTRIESAGHTFEEYTRESEKLRVFIDKVEDRVAAELQPLIACL